MAASTLPVPSADAQAHSAHLREVIQEQIIAAGGRIPFWKFMELALYAPGLGYYSAGAHQVRPGRRLHHRAGAFAAVLRLRGRRAGAGAAAGSARARCSWKWAAAAARSPRPA